MVNAFAALAAALRPASQGVVNVLVIAEDDWRWPGGRVPQDAAAIFWGRNPYPPTTSRLCLVRIAAAREVGLRRARLHSPDNIPLRAVHRLHPQRLHVGSRDALRSKMLAGALVEFSRPDIGPRVIDVVTGAADVTPGAQPLIVGGNGSILLRGRHGHHPAILRIWPDTVMATVAADALTSLSKAGIVGIPLLLGQGVDAGKPWTTETLLSGTRPRFLSRALVDEVVRFATLLPRSTQPPLVTPDILELSRLLPSYARHLAALAQGVEQSLLGLPSVFRHGDLWSGNLLTGCQQLTGVVDWDKCRDRSAPGIDLMHLIGIEKALLTRTPLGSIWLRCPWRSDSFLEMTAGYWGALGIRPHGRTLDAVAVAWWLGYTDSLLRQCPDIRQNDTWISRNVTPVLESVIG